MKKTPILPGETGEGIPGVAHRFADPDGDTVFEVDLHELAAPRRAVGATIVEQDAFL